MSALPPLPWCKCCTRPAHLRVQICKLCANTDPEDNFRWFCTMFCRELDTEAHKNECKVLIERPERLERAQKAADLAQILFYAFLENTWAHDISLISIGRSREDTLTDIEITSRPGAPTVFKCDTTCERLAGGWMIKFPADILLFEDVDVQNAILASHNSVWTFVFMHVVVGALFGDMVRDPYKDIKEVVHYVPNSIQHLVKHRDGRGNLGGGRYEVLYPDHDEHGNFKSVYQITLKTGDKMALNLTSAQFVARFNTFVPWQEYSNQWGHEVKYCVPLGTHRRQHIKRMLTYNCVTYHTIVMHQMKCFNNMIQNFDDTFGITLEDILSSSDNLEDYHTHVEAQVKNQLDDNLQKLDTDHEDELFMAPFDLRHPKFGAQAGKHDSFSFQLPQLEGIEAFDWNSLRRFIQLDSKDVSYKEKKMARAMLQYRSVYQKPGDWRWVFLPFSVPSDIVPRECKSENPYCKRR